LIKREVIVLLEVCELSGGGYTKTTIVWESLNVKDEQPHSHDGVE